MSVLSRPVDSHTRTGVVYPQKSVWYQLCPSRLLVPLFCLPVVGGRTSLQMYWYHLTDQVCQPTSRSYKARRTSARLVASLRRRLVAFFFALSSVVDPLLLVVPVRARGTGWTGRCARPSAVSALLFDAVPGGARGARSCGAGPRALRAPTFVSSAGWMQYRCAAMLARQSACGGSESSTDNSQPQDISAVCNAPCVFLYGGPSRS